MAALDWSCSGKVRPGVGARSSGWRQDRFTPEGDRPERPSKAAPVCGEVREGLRWPCFPWLFLFC